MVKKFLSNKKANRFFMVAVLALSILSLIAPAAVYAQAPDKQEFFICPSVNSHNPNAMWVIGGHGAYYVVIPEKGGAKFAADPKVYVTVPVSVAAKAQIPAGWKLYKDLDTYPNFEGTAMLLAEGITKITDLGGIVPDTWAEGDVVMVVNNGNGTYNVMNKGMMAMGPDKDTMTIDFPIPLYSAVFW
ncbi:MAG: hypothetical protein K0B14_12410 [Anaerolineaceae bacterium]|nr:hypothetical protein [Anaerolineaceae bacterium]